MVSPGFSGLSLLQDLLFYRTYSETKSSGFKETFDETVDRSMQMHIDKFPQHSDAIVKAFSLVRNKILVPSMRSFQFAGRAVKRENLRMYNCSWMPIDNVDTFGDIAYALMVGAGVGFSVQKCHISQLPAIKRPYPDYWVINDDREGWADSFKQLVLNPGLEFVYGFIRPAGARLSSGGTASGSDVLKISHAKIREILLGAVGRKLRSIEVHDIVCHIADCVVAGGSRRCLPFDSLVHTNRGLIRIEDVRVGDKVQTTEGFRDVLEHMDQGIQKTVCINTDAGVVECTPNHRVAVIDGYRSYSWKPASELSVGDRLLHTLIPLECPASSLPSEEYIKSNHANTLKDIVIPELSADICWFLGYFQGNGSVGVYTDSDNKKHGRISVSIPSYSQERIDRCISALSKFGVNVSVHDGCGEVKVVKASSMRLARYFLNNVKVAKESMSVPSFISTGSLEQRRAFICGLFDADGAAGCRPVNISSIYGKYLDQIRVLCSSIGIPSYVRESREANGEWQTLYKICFKSVGKKELARILKTYGTKRIPDSRGVQNSYSYPSAMVPFMQRPKSCSVSLDYIDNGQEPFAPAKIISISEGRTVRTYDISVKDKHEFYADGFLVHNSATLSQFDADDEEMLNCKAGNWWEKNPQRGRANNSATIYRDDEDFGGKFYQAMHSSISSNCGEPGILLSNSKDYGYNPCLPAYATVLTPEGIRTFADIDEGSVIWSGKRWTKVIKKWSTGIKEVFEYKTESRCVFQGTENHRIVQNGKKIEVKDATHIDTCIGPSIITSKIIESRKIDVCEVFDITVDDEEHTFWSGGCVVSNCGEISLKAVCNLTEINAAACSTKSQFLEAVNAATFIGKLQSSYTDFHYVQPRFKQWAEEEMLLGVSITGQADAWNLIGDADVLRAGAAEALRTDEEWAAVLGIPLAKRICTTKPSGSTSLLLGVSSGIHAAHSPFYIRRVRLDKTDPVAKYLIEQVGVGEACSGSIVEYDKFAPHNVVVSVPVAKSGSIVRNQESAVSLMNRAKHVRDNWILPTHREGPNTHNVSLTVNYRQNEIGEMIDWMYKNRDSYAGISILPDSDSSFVQLPFEEISIQDYITWKDKFQDVKFDLSSINFGGTVDTRQGEMACAGGACQISSL